MRRKAYLFATLCLVVSLSLFLRNSPFSPPEVLAPTHSPVATPQLVESNPNASTAAVLGTSTTTAHVAKVVDGDTIKLDSGETVRYIGVDTPETVHPTKPVQCYGKEASARNKELVADKEVVLEKDVSETDRYGRLLRYVWVDGVLINQQLVAEGYAVARSFPPDVKRQDEFRAAEAQARAADRGLWHACP